MMDSDYYSLTPRAGSSSQVGTPSTANAKKNGAGTILKVTMKNFMCHEHFSIELNRRINFINGKNGSGKSAIQTAIAIGLGGRALESNRASSLKNLIMNNKNSCTISITLSNTGTLRFKPKEYDYGSEIVVERHFTNSSSSYKIKDEIGKTKSTEKRELDRITSHFNIQVNNPICILHQDIAKVFLNTDDTKKKFSFFLKASRLEDISSLYEESRQSIKHLRESVGKQIETTEERFHDVIEMRKKAKIMEEANEKRRRCGILQNELVWAQVREVESQIEDLEKKKILEIKEKKKFEDRINELQGRNLEEKLRGLEAKIEQIDNSVKDAKEKLRPAKQDWGRKKELLANKREELSEVNKNVKLNKRKYDSCIEEMEKNKRNAPELKLKQENLKKDIDTWTSKVQSISAAQESFEIDKQRFQDTMDKIHDKLRTLHDQISDLQQQKRKREDQHRQLTKSSNSLTVYGHLMTSIVDEVNRAFEQRKFQQKPVGPIGVHIKVRDPAWAGPVEDFLKRGFLSSFCVDNKRDFEVLKNIFNRVCGHNKASHPTIFCSKFIPKVHNYAAHEARDNQFTNLARALDVNNPVVMNCLIDNQEPETILLIPNNDSAYNLLDEEHKVPRNCKKAFTLSGDLFFAAPNYKSYSSQGDVSRATLLQTNQEALIRQLKEEINRLTQQINELEHERQSTLGQQRDTQLTMRGNETELAKLKQAKHSGQQKIRDLTNELETENDANTDYFIEERKELETQLSIGNEKLKTLTEEYSELKSKVKTAEKIHEELQNTIAESDKEKAPIQVEIQGIRSGMQEASTRLVILEQEFKERENNVNKINTEITERTQELTQTTDNASQHCDRMHTRRSIEEIQREVNSITSYLKNIEEENGGSLEVLREKINERRSEYDKVVCDLNSVGITAQRIYRTLKERRARELSMKVLLSNAIKTHFCTNLALRDFEGKLKFDFEKKTLELEVRPLNDNSKNVATASLSGGEKSFSTVCFILALWQESQMPFHFLDEFDVFMDGVNRRTAMDLLITFAKNNIPPSQFVFLTPLDVSNISIPQEIFALHRLEPPVRGVTSISSSQ